MELGKRKLYRLLFASHVLLKEGGGGEDLKAPKRIHFLIISRIVQ